jgi:hypothetical protein
MQEPLPGSAQFALTGRSLARGSSTSNSSFQKPCREENSREMRAMRLKTGSSDVVCVWPTRSREQRSHPIGCFCSTPMAVPLELVCELRVEVGRTRHLLPSTTARCRRVSSQQLQDLMAADKKVRAVRSFRPGQAGPRVRHVRKPRVPRRGSRRARAPDSSRPYNGGVRLGVEAAPSTARYRVQPRLRPHESRGHRPPDALSPPGSAERSGGGRQHLS